MKKIIFRFILLATIFLGSLSAQSFVGKLNPYPIKNLVTTSDDTLKILAVLADFKPDEDDATFGDGTFGSIYSQEYGNDIIDPLPHDASYFRDHLEFAKNYFTKVSNNRLQIEYDVIEGIVSLNKIMRDYSPNPNSESDFSALAAFAGEVWTKADAANQGLNFSDYDLFTIFHAGVGRDIDVPGSIGNDRDLPSVYLSESALTNALGENFEGFPVQNGSYNITNSMILPETESRELESFGSVTLLELSINGLLVASIASHLGLPDLFNTETGLSAIGRFGLMDGQSIFTFAGLFPPEPSPWEKMYLGWLDPLTISNANGKINLVAEEIATLADTTVIKIPINSNEYYLIENRSRDAKKDGAVITFKVDGQLKTISFDKDYDNFISFNVDTISGVVIDVDEYDWAVPAFDRNDSDLNTFTDVGLVIWHIDESVINEKLVSNTINNNKFLKGVRVVEADGIDDIGEEFQTIFGDFVIGEGSKEDTWYKENPSELYRNRFNSISSPASISNTGANTLISLTDFSAVDVRMRFNLSFGSANTSLVSTFDVQSTQKILWTDAVSSDAGSNFIFTNNNEIVVTDAKGDDIINRPLKIDYKPSVIKLDDQLIVVSTNDRSIDVTSTSGTFTSKDSVRITTSPVVTNIEDNVQFYLGNADGFVNKYELKNDLLIIVDGIKANKAFDDAVKQIASRDEFVAVISESAYWDSEIGRITLEAEPLQVSIAKNNSEYYSIVLLANNKIVVLKYGNIVSTIELPSSDFEIISFALGDLRGDGSSNIVVNTGNSLSIYNLFGARILTISADANDMMKSTFTPLLLDLNTDNLSDVLTFSNFGRINAYSGLNGDVINPYPISFSGYGAQPIIFNSNNQTKLLAVDKSNQVSLWNVTSTPNKVDWANRFGNSYNNASVGEPESVNKIQELFPKSEAYNWPNPVYGNTTYFHFFVGEDSDVEINIFDLAGDRVDKLSKNVVGGYENEISWDVSDVQSGIYLAHLNVKASNGSSHYKIIKVAVIK